MKRSIILLILLTAAPQVWSHASSDSYLYLHEDNNAIQIRWDIALRDLQSVIELDVDNNGEIRWGEVTTQLPAIIATANSALTVSANGKVCENRINKAARIAEYGSGYFISLQFEPHCKAELQGWKIDYNFLFDIDADHRGILLLANAAQRKSALHVFSPDARSFQMQNIASQPDLIKILKTYLASGIHHILIGYDHILFLMTLVVPAVLVRGSNLWQPSPNFHASLHKIVWLVSAFTVAHSMTLSLSVFEVINPPSRWIELLIAFSILISAIHNIRPLYNGPGWILAFAFGLIHGFGFANVLLDVGLSGSYLAVSLLGFNLGVEIGQVAIVLLVFPPLYAIRKLAIFQPMVLRGGSVLAGLIAIFWIVERTHGV